MLVVYEVFYYFNYVLICLNIIPTLFIYVHIILQFILTKISIEGLDSGLFLYSGIHNILCNSQKYIVLLLGKFMAKKNYYDGRGEIDASAAQVDVYLQQLSDDRVCRYR